MPTIEKPIELADALSKISELETSRNDLDSLLETLRNANTQLTTDLTASNILLENAVKASDSANDKYTELNLEFTSAKEQIDQLNAHVLSLESTNGTLTTEVAELRSQVDAADELVNEAAAGTAAAEEQSTALQNQFDNIANHLSPRGELPDMINVNQIEHLSPQVGEYFRITNNKYSTSADMRRATQLYRSNKDEIATELDRRSGDRAKSVLNVSKPDVNEQDLAKFEQWQEFGRQTRALLTGVVTKDRRIQYSQDTMQYQREYRQNKDLYDRCLKASASRPVENN